MALFCKIASESTHMSGDVNNIIAGY